MKIKYNIRGANYRDTRSTRSIMNELTIALLVIVAMAIYYNFTISTQHGMATISIVFTSIITAIVCEAIYFYFKKPKAIVHSILQSFPCVTAIIFALVIPVGTPLFVVVIGSAVSIVFGKLIYGGFGHNIFNPAMVGRIFVSLSYASHMTTTIPGVDATTSATVVSAMDAGNWVVDTKLTIPELLIGFHDGSLGETFALVIIIIGFILALRKVLDYRIPLFYVGTAFVIAVAVASFHQLDVFNFAIKQILMGGLLFGAVFMLSDPVTSPTSNHGKIIFAIGAAFITMLIRFKATSVEGVMYAVLIMNMLTPLIERYTVSMSDYKLNRKALYIVGAIVLSALVMLPVSNASFGISFPGFQRKSVTEVEKWCDLSSQKDFGITCTFEGSTSPNAVVVENPVPKNTIIKRDTKLVFRVKDAQANNQTNEISEVIR